MELAEVQARIRAMALRGFILRRSKTQWSAYGSIYEFRSVNGAKYYPVHRDHIMFPKLDPTVAIFVRKLFTSLDQGNEIHVQGEYTKRHLTGKLLLLPVFTVPEEEPEESGSQQPISILHLATGKQVFSPPAVPGPALSRLNHQLTKLTEAAQHCLEEA